MASSPKPVEGYQSLDLDGRGIVDDQMRDLSKRRVVCTIGAIVGLALVGVAIAHGGAGNYFVAGVVGFGTMTYLTLAVLAHFRREKLKAEFQITEEERQMQYNLEDLRFDLLDRMTQIPNDVRTLIDGVRRLGNQTPAPLHQD